MANLARQHFSADAFYAWIAGQQGDRLAGLDATVEIQLLGLRLGLADLYAGLAFRSQPTPVDPADNPASKFSI
jgi:hypothetical protein